MIPLEGEELVAVEVGHGDSDHSTCLNVPSIGLLVAGMLPTTTSINTSWSQTTRSEASGSARSTRSNRSNHGPLSQGTSDRGGRTARRFSKRPGNTSGTLTASTGKPRLRWSFTTRCSGCILTGSILAFSGRRRSRQREEFPLSELSISNQMSERIVVECTPWKELHWIPKSTQGSQSQVSKSCIRRVPHSGRPRRFWVCK